MLSMVGLAAKYKSLPRQLSGGEQQRVAIARALVNEPKILLADEPTGNLDENNAWEIMKLLEEINERGTTVVVVTHNLDIVKAMKKRVITMRKGVVISDEDLGGTNAVSYTHLKCRFKTEYIKSCQNDHSVDDLQDLYHGIVAHIFLDQC